MKNPFDDDDTDDNDESFADALPAPPDTEAGNEGFDLSSLPPPPPVRHASPVSSAVLLG